MKSKTLRALADLLNAGFGQTVIAGIDIAEYFRFETDSIVCLETNLDKWS